jgi:hypothetical protein
VPSSLRSIGPTRMSTRRSVAEKGQEELFPLRGRVPEEDRFQRSGSSPTA